MKKIPNGSCFSCGKRIRQVLLVMKLTTFLLLIGALSLSASTYSQVTRMDLKMENSKIQDILHSIENSSEFIFIYDAAYLNTVSAISINVKAKTIIEILDELFKDTGVAYLIDDRQVVLYNSKDLTSLTSARAEIAVAQQQKKELSGIVKDGKGLSLPGVSVFVKGTTTGTVTDSEGKFTLSIPNEAKILVFSFVGMKSQEVQITQKSTVNVTLDEEAVGVDEVVVVGYGTQKKVNLTGAVEVVKGDALVNRATTTVSQALQGKVSGINFSSGVYGFEPGASLAIQIRGQGSPLILIDGVAGSLDGLNPNDIESMSVLKDAAAAAIYGAQAPYGVVLITTKSGKKDGKLNIEFSSSVSGIKPIRMPHLADSYTTALALNEASINSGITPIYTNATIDRIIKYQADPINTPETVPSSANAALWANTYESNANYDWFNVYYGEGTRNQENLSVSGGSDAFSYYVSGGQIYDEGILQVAKDDYHRYNTIAKFDAKLTKWFKFSLNTRYYNTLRTRPAYDNQGDYDLLFHQVARTFPSQYMKSPNGILSIQSKIPWARDAGDETWNTNEFVNRFATEITPLKGWTINADYSFQLTNSEYTSNNYTVYEDKVDGSPVISGSTSPSFVKKSQQNYFYKTLNAYTTYKIDIKDIHHISVMAGYQQEESKTSYLWAKKNDMVSQEVPAINTSTGTIDATDNLAHYATQGYFTRLNYNFKDKYLVEVNGRYDGTYKFAKDKRWGFFPSLSMGWNVSNEKFWESFRSRINMFKIRTSWGGLGNQVTASAYQDLPLMGVGSNLGWIINSRRPGYTTAPNLVNADVTWETSNTKDLGIDLGVLKNRLTFTGDIYKRDTYDQLGPADALPAVIGVTTLPKSNNMETVTNGWELSLTWKDKIGKDFSYSATAMMFDYLTKVTKYNNPTMILTNPYSGQTVGEIWGFVSDGLIQTQADADAINTGGTQKAISGQVWKSGDVKYKDLTGEGIINYGANTVNDPGDRKVIGNATPRYQYGLTLSAGWKGFDFSVFMQGVAKRDLAISGNMFWGFSSAVQGSIFPGHLNYYRDVAATTYAGLGINTDSYFPRPYTDANMNNKNQITQTRYLQNGAFMRLKTMQLGYTLPKVWLDKIKMQGIYLYVSGENLWTITKMAEYLDPETANVGSRGNAKSYFSQAAVTVGLNVKF